MVYQSVYDTDSADNYMAVRARAEEAEEADGVDESTD
jgi:hypothetical protein